MWRCRVDTHRLKSVKALYSQLKFRILGLNLHKLILDRDLRFFLVNQANPTFQSFISMQHGFQSSGVRAKLRFIRYYEDHVYKVYFNGQCLLY